MAKVIIYSDFLDTTQKSHLINNLEYISTRDGVALNLDDEHFQFEMPNEFQERSVTQKQKMLLKDILLRFPQVNQLSTFKDYQESKNMFTANQLINESLLFIKNQKNANAIYMNYIGERPRVEIFQDELHGLFDINGIADIEKYKNELSNNTSIIYRHIISLKREDAENLGYDKRESWEMLLRAKTIALSKSMGIPDNDFKWVAAFHNEGHHPHVHLMCWSESGKYGYLKEKDIENFKSVLTNTIFADEMWLMKEFKTEARNELETVFEETLKEYLNEFNNVKINELEKNSINSKLSTIAQNVNTYGKKVYAYQNQETKLLIDDLVADLLNNEKIYPLLTEYVTSQENLIKMYKQDPNKINEEIQSFMNRLVHPDLKDRKVLHNVIVKTAYEYAKCSQKQINSIEKCINLDKAFLNETDLLKKYSVILTHYDLGIDESIEVLTNITNDKEEIIVHLFDAKHLEKEETQQLVSSFFATKKTLHDQLLFSEKLNLDGNRTVKFQLPAILFSRIHTVLKDRTFEEKIAHFRRLNLIANESRQRKNNISKYTN